MAAALGGILTALLGAGGNMGMGIAQGAIEKGWSETAARRQRRWLEKMSNTAFQRGTEDLRKAGLNPMLAYTAGSASTPGAAMQETPSIGRSEIDFGAAMSSVKQVKLLNNEVQRSEQVLQQEKERTRQEVVTTNVAEKFAEALAASQILEQRAHTNASNMNASATEAVKRLNEAAYPAAKAEADLYSTTGGALVRQAAPVIRLLRDVFGPLFGSAAKR